MMCRIPYSALVRTAASGASVVLLWGCASAKPAHVPVAATRSELAALVGRWEGSYESPATGRSGSIVFELVSASADSAFGDVVMVPRGTVEPLHPAVQDGAERSRPSPQLLQIRFVEVSEGIVSGTLQPYRDPESGFALDTRFTGRLAGDRIEGTFVTTGVHLTTPQRGTWSVRRTRGHAR
jgi:hypothetical protein